MAGNTDLQHVRTAISTQSYSNFGLASRDEAPGLAIVALVVALGLDVEVDHIRDPLVSAARRMLVDQRGAFAVVPHPRHQVLEARAAVRRELVTRVPQIVNMRASRPDRLRHMRPSPTSCQGGACCAAGALRAG